MIELTNSVSQTIPPGGIAKFDTVVAQTGCDVCHRCGSGQVQLEGHGTRCNPARYSVSISGNIGGGAATQANIAVAVNDESLFETVRVATITAATDVFPFAAQTNVKECGSCCDTVTIMNVGTTDITLSNPSFKVRRTS